MLSSQLGIGVVRSGYWGPNLVRNFVAHSATNVVAVIDFSSARLALYQSLYPAVTTAERFEDLLKNLAIEVIAIATPVHSHYDLALVALKAGKHVLVEKPLAPSADLVRHLVSEADRHNLILMVDHIFPYTAAVRKISEIVRQRDLGDVYYYDSAHISLGLFQSVSPVKMRQTFIGGSKKMIVYDDMEPTEKIKVYDKGITLDGSSEDASQLRIGYRAGDMWVPHTPATEALQTEVSQFVDCVRKGVQPISDGLSGLRMCSRRRRAPSPNRAGPSLWGGSCRPYARAAR